MLPMDVELMRRIGFGYNVKFCFERWNPFVSIDLQYLQFIRFSKALDEQLIISAICDAIYVNMPITDMILSNTY